MKTKEELARFIVVELWGKEDEERDKKRKLPKEQLTIFDLFPESKVKDSSMIEDQIRDFLESKDGSLDFCFNVYKEGYKDRCIADGKILENMKKQDDFVEITIKRKDKIYNAKRIVDECQYSWNIELLTDKILKEVYNDYEN